MHQIPIRLLKARSRSLIAGWSCLVAAAGCAPSAHAQAAPVNLPVAVLWAMIKWRDEYLGEHIRVGACSALQVLGSLSRIPTEFPFAYPNQLARESSECTAPVPDLAMSGEPMISVLSLTVSNSTATLKVNVVRGESQHIETFQLLSFKLGSRTIWSVTTVQMSGGMHTGLR